MNCKIANGNVRFNFQNIELTLGDDFLFCRLITAVKHCQVEQFYFSSCSRREHNPWQNSLLLSLVLAIRDSVYNDGQ